MFFVGIKCAVLLPPHLDKQVALGYNKKDNAMFEWEALKNENILATGVAVPFGGGGFSACGFGAWPR